MFDWILDPIGYVITIPSWTIFVTLPFILLKYIALGIETIATVLPKFLLFGGQEMSLDNLPSMFIRFIIIAVALFFILWIAVFFRYLFQNAETGIQSAITACKYSLLCWVYIMVIPLGIFALYLLIDWLLELIGALDENNNIANLLFLSIKPEGISQSAWESVTNKNFLLSLGDFKAMGGLSNMYNIQFAIFLEFAIAVGVLLAYLFAGFTITTKIFDQVFLFIISPAIATTSILDGGKRLNAWKDLVISKAFIVFGIVLGSRIYISLLGYTVQNIHLITDIQSTSFWVNFPNYIVILLIAGGGAFAFSEFGNLLSSFLGEGFGIKQSMAQTRGMLHAFGTSGAIGKAATKLAGGLGGFAASKALNKTIKKNSDEGPPDINKFNPGSGTFGQFTSGMKSKFTNDPESKMHYAQHQIYSTLQKQKTQLDNWRKIQYQEIMKNTKLTELEKQEAYKQINKQYNKELQQYTSEAQNKMNEAKSEFQVEMDKRKATEGEN